MWGTFGLQELPRFGSLFERRQDNVNANDFDLFPHVWERPEIPKIPLKAQKIRDIQEESLREFEINLLAANTFDWINQRKGSDVQLCNL